MCQSHITVKWGIFIKIAGAWVNRVRYIVFVHLDFPHISGAYPFLIKHIWKPLITPKGKFILTQMNIPCEMGCILCIWRRNPYGFFVEKTLRKMVTNLS